MANERIGEETRERVKAIWDEFLAEVADGALVKDALAKRGITDGMKRAFLANNPEARAQWDEARRSSSYAFMEEALELARSKTIQLYNADGSIAIDKYGQPLLARPDSGFVRAQADILKWASKVRNPGEFSDKSSVDLNIRTQPDITGVIARAEERERVRLAALNAALPAITGTAVRVEDEGGGTPDT